MHDNRTIYEQVQKQFAGDLLIFPSLFIKDRDDGSGFIYSPKRDFITDEDVLKILKNNI